LGEIGFWNLYLIQKLSKFEIVKKYMDDKIINIIRFFFKENFSQKRLVVILAAVLTDIFLFFLCYQQNWFNKLTSDYGNTVIVVFLSISFLIAFIIYELICNEVSVYLKRENRRVRKLKFRYQKTEERYKALSRLTDWQKEFIIDMVTQGKSQIKAYEIGVYKAAWDLEMEALIAKKIIRELSFENYEIDPEYYDYIKNYYNPENEVLRLPNIKELYDC
jgi:hypothetical protein